MEHVKKNIFQRAAEWGLPFGLYLACTGAAAIYADRVPLFGILFIFLTLGAPVLCYLYQRRKFIEDDGFTDFSSLWMLGILLFILGTVVSSFIIFLVLQYLRPNFIYEQAQALIELYSKTPETQNSEVLTVLKHLVEEKLLPRPIEAVFNTFWFITFTGSISSAVTALIAGLRIKKRKPEN